jgi:hypothetical protein
MGNLAIHPRTSIVDACFAAWRSGHHVKTVNGVPELAPGRDRNQILKAFKAKALLEFASELLATKQ